MVSNDAFGNQSRDLGISSGGERTRTADFHVANVALYQLSYTPELPAGPLTREDGL